MNNNSDKHTIVRWKPYRNSDVRESTVERLRSWILSEDIDERVLISIGGQKWLRAEQIPALADAFDQVTVHRRPAKPVDADVDLGPMIDVTFLLLLFFMLTATYDKQKTIDTPAPPKEGAVARPTLDEIEKDNIIINLDAAGALLIDGVSLPWEDFSTRLENRMNERKTTNVVIIAVSEAAWKHVVRVQDECGLAGIERIRFGKGVSPAIQ